jgi:hypothetical protein
MEWKCSKTPPFTCGSWADDECPCNSTCLSSVSDGKCVFTGLITDMCSEPYRCFGMCEMHETELCYDLTRSFCI